MNTLIGSFGCTRTLAAVAGLLAFVGTAQAQSFTGRYPIGVEGIKAASFPPPGFYLRDYNLFYWADQYRGDGPPDFDLFVYGQAPKPTWVTDLKLLGANYGVDAIIPFLYTDIEAGGDSTSRFGLGDICVEPFILGWHWQKVDMTFAAGFWAPTGDSDKGDIADPGVGFWSAMLTFGGTWYPDTEKTWAFSILNRYEINTESEDYDVTPGNALSLEWGVSKALNKTVEVGAVGYYQQQTTHDSGSGASDHLDRVFAVGPEVSVFWAKPGLSISARFLWEFEAEDRPEGNKAVLTITKRF